MHKWIAVVGVITISTTMGLAQDVEKGENVFKQWCLPCHSIGPNAKNKIGPELNGLEGRHSGSVPGIQIYEGLY